MLSNKSSALPLTTDGQLDQAALARVPVAMRPTGTVTEQLAI
jgi:hypothetical protein